MGTRLLVHYVFIGAVLMLMSLGASYVLPVKYIWFNKNDEHHTYPLSTVHQWASAVKEWNWVSSYKMQWVFPDTLKLSISMKNPLARQADGSFIANDASVFHLRKKHINLPLVEVLPEHLSQAMGLLQQLQSHFPIQHIYEYASGAVLIEINGYQQMVFPAMEMPPKLVAVINKLPQQGSWYCHFGHTQYASCQVRR